MTKEELEKENAEMKKQLTKAMKKCDKCESIEEVQFH